MSNKNHYLEIQHETIQPYVIKTLDHPLPIF